MWALDMDTVVLYVLCASRIGFVRKETGHTHKHTTRTPPHNTRHDKNTPHTTTRRTTPNIGFVNRIDVIWYKLDVFAVEGVVFA